MRADTTSLRSHNSQLLLRLLREFQPTSAKLLIEQTGMQASTVSRLLKTLSARGLVQANGVNADSRAGRPAELWGLNGAFGMSIGIYLASNLVAGCSTDVNGRILDTCIIPFRDPEKQTAQSLLGMLSEALRRLTSSDRVVGYPTLGVGIASMGLVDRNLQTFKYFGETVDPARLDSLNSRPLYLENDANAVARGESTHGALSGIENAIVLYAHEGIGAGLLLNGSLHRGYRGAAGEVGYRGTFYGEIIMRHNTFTRPATGFTLIELLIVVAIIAILAAIAVPNFLEAQTRSKVSRMKADMRTIATGLESYAVDWNKYPPDPIDRIRMNYPASQRYDYSTIEVFYPLTTPIAYLTSASPAIDIFQEQKPFDPGVPGSYGHVLWVNAWPPAAPDVFNDGAGAVREGIQLNWILASFGPDRESSAINMGRPINNFPITGSYDPTNGTLSLGDISRHN